MQQILKFITCGLERDREAATVVVVAPDDEHENVRNMLSCI
jgi:hypothetical protein